MHTDSPNLPFLALSAKQMLQPLTFGAESPTKGTPQPPDPRPGPMITFSEECPVTKMQHSFTYRRSILLSGKLLEMSATNIRYSTSSEHGLCEARSRPLTEMILKVIAWEKGLTPHPLIPEIGPCLEKKKRPAASPLAKESKVL
ncbi:hypothetical protein LLEC1_07313 [Akanthomyces lecanii]|uniref:Uncharacterized protein n=1 Tax=Cordyceps confragosa TaxID=2714763 RepID=A0A179I5P9_CORDF|nr:hypothetical protein LLEC1_07313 [Akanthomyces lecanii]